MAGNVRPHARESTCVRPSLCIRTSSSIHVLITSSAYLSCFLQVGFAQVGTQLLSNIDVHSKQSEISKTEKVP